MFGSDAVKVALATFASYSVLEKSTGPASNASAPTEHLMLTTNWNPLFGYVQPAATYFVVSAASRDEVTVTD